MVAPVAFAAVLALSFAPHSKGVGHWWGQNESSAASVAPANGQLEVIWLEDQMCFCTLTHRPPVVPDGYRTPFGAARRVHSDFRGRTVDAVEGADL